MQEPTFLPGLELAGEFYGVVGPIVAGVLPGRRQAAALLGYGSDVLGYDTEMSRDHEWGPRLQIFLAEADAGECDRLAETLRDHLPVSFRGYPTNFGPAGDPIRRMTAVPQGPVDHKVEVTTVRAYGRAQLGFDPLGGVTAGDWLSAPQQRLLGVTAGAVFRDDMGELTEMRRRLAWYPDDVWLALMARQWSRVAEREAFPGRAASVGDALGCRLLVGEIVRDLIRLAFLAERRYAPYSKWLGTAFGSLESAARMRPHIDGALGQGAWPEREAHLGRLHEIVADVHNDLRVTRPLEPVLRNFHERPFLVIGAERFADALRDQVDDPQLRQASTLGAVDQWVDAVEALGSPALSSRLQRGAAGPAVS
jgi:hypothetical protein